MRILPFLALGLAWLATTTLAATSGGDLAGLQVLLAGLAGAGLVGGVRWRWTAATTFGVLVLLGSYALGLVLRDAVDDRAPLVAAALVAVVLCASWASEPPATAAVPADDPGRTRLLAVLATTLGAGALGGLVLAASATGGSRSLWLQAAGAAAALATVGALLALSRRSGTPAGPVLDPLRRRRLP